MSNQQNQEQLINQISNLPFEERIALIKMLNESTKTLKENQIIETANYLASYLNENSQKYDLSVEVILRKLVELFPKEFKNILENTTPKIKRSSAPKYRNPLDSTQTWTGKGPKPQWVKNLLNSGGKTLEDLKI